MPTPEEVHKQFLFNTNLFYDAQAALEEFERDGGGTPWQKQQLEEKLKFRKSMMDGFAKQWNMLTGRTLYVMLPAGLDSGPDDIDRAERAAAQRPVKIKERIKEVRNDLTRLQDNCERSVENRLKNFFVAQFTDVFVQGGPLVPVHINKTTTKLVEAALANARTALGKGRLDEAEQELVRAAESLERGFATFNQWVADRENGAGRPEAVIKTAHSVTTSAVCGLAGGGRIGAMACSAYAELTLQAPLLALQQLSGKQQVTLEDLKKASKEVAIAGASAGAGEAVGAILSKGLASQLAARILGKTPSKEAIQFVEDRIKAWVVINSSEVAKKMTGLKTDDYDAWLMIVAPAIHPQAVELMKEKELHNTWLPNADFNFK